MEENHESAGGWSTVEEDCGGLRGSQQIGLESHRFEVDSYCCCGRLHRYVLWWCSGCCVVVVWLLCGSGVVTVW